MKDNLGSRILKVNHAGENGAVNIYAAQILVARITAPAMVAELAEFKSHEEKHRQIFWSEMEGRRMRRCRSYILCGVGGYTLGLVTALFGSRSIAATTLAVERVVLRHLDHQLAELRGTTDSGAVAAIEAIIFDERMHHDASSAKVLAGGFWLRLLSPIVAFSTEAVIWVGMHV